LRAVVVGCYRLLGVAMQLCIVAARLGALRSNVL
jgi:hypothetical protein